jgi:hypothetical protein
MPRFEDLSPKTVVALSAAAGIAFVTVCLVGAHALLGALASILGVQ